MNEETLRVVEKIEGFLEKKEGLSDEDSYNVVSILAHRYLSKVAEDDNVEDDDYDLDDEEEDTEEYDAPEEEDESEQEPVDEELGQPVDPYANDPEAEAMDVAVAEPTAEELVDANEDPEIVEKVEQIKRTPLPEAEVPKDDAIKAKLKEPTPDQVDSGDF